MSVIFLIDLTSFLHRECHLGTQLGCIFGYCLDHTGDYIFDLVFIKDVNRFVSYRSLNPVPIGSQSSSSPSYAPAQYIWRSLSVECISDRCLLPLNLCFGFDLHRLLLKEPNYFQYIDSIIVSDTTAPSC